MVDWRQLRGFLVFLYLGRKYVSVGPESCLLFLSWHGSQDFTFVSTVLYRINDVRLCWTDSAEHMLAVFTAPTAEGFSPHLRNPCTQQHPSLLCFAFVQQGHTVEAQKAAPALERLHWALSQPLVTHCAIRQTVTDATLSVMTWLQSRQPKPQPNPDKVLACSRLDALWEREGRVPASDITCHEGADGAMSPKLLLQVWAVQSWGCFWENSNFEKYR